MTDEIKALKEENKKLQKQFFESVKEVAKLHTENAKLEDVLIMCKALLKMEKI